MRVIPFLADQFGLFIQFQCAGLQVVIEAVSHLVVGDVLGWFGNPVQHLHTVTASTGGDRMNDFPGAAMTAYFHAGQVPHLADQCASVGPV
ncbi:hypothetical protein D3C72_1692150 [compost metagenome]